jgi:hypothetical protein
MAVEHLFAAVDIERRPAFVMQRAKSGDFVASVVANDFPAVSLEIFQQRNRRLERAVVRIDHGERGSANRIRLAANQSQAKRVGVHSRNRRLATRRENHRRTVEGSCDAIRIAAIRCGLFERAPLAQPIKRLLAGRKVIRRARHAPARQRRQRSPANLADATTNHNRVVHGVMRLSPPPAMTDNRDLPACRTLPGQPLGVIAAGLASVARTWDKDDHRCEGYAPGIGTPPRHMTPRPRLRS